MDKTKYSMVFITSSTEAETEKIKDGILHKHQAACVSVVPRIKSSCWWKGEIESATEFMLIAKTRTSLIPDIIQLVKKNHSAQVPEIIATPIINGNPEYLEWIDEETKGPIVKELP
jgi:periplasmic divalent cation tolerance protein